MEDHGEQLHNSHAGELLASEFMEPLELITAALAASLGIDAALLQSVLDGQVRMNADLDMRLAKRFRMSEGFFIRLQDDYEAREIRWGRENGV